MAGASSNSDTIASTRNPRVEWGGTVVRRISSRPTRAKATPKMQATRGESGNGTARVHTAPGRRPHAHRTLASDGCPRTGAPLGLPRLADPTPVDAPPLRRTSLYEAHKRLGGRMVPFAGWDMPVQYSGVTDEHKAVRTAA